MSPQRAEALLYVASRASARGDSVMTPISRTVEWAARDHAGWWAFALQRVSGLALTLFLPAHFLVLGRALQGEAALQGFLGWTDQPLVRASETVLVFLLAA